MRVAAATILITGSLLSIALAQPASLSPKSFEGVWKITKVVRAGVVDKSPPPGLTIFSHGYFSIVRVNGSEVRKASPALKNPEKLSDAEKIALHDEWAPFGAMSGTYEVNGNTLITHNIVAKNVKGMNLTEKAAIRFEGDTFIAHPLPGEPNSDRETTYTRLK